MKFKVQGETIIIDDCDSWIIDNYNFNIVKDHKSEYKSVKCALKNFSGKRKHTTLCYLVLKKKKGMIIDHKNRNPFDNRKCNLRFVNSVQNSWNRGKQNSFKGKLTTSKFKGVSYFKNNNNWRTRIAIEGEVIYLGHYPTEIKAAKAYDQKAKELFGEFAFLNFPNTRKKKLIKRY